MRCVRGLWTTLIFWSIVFAFVALPFPPFSKLLISDPRLRVRRFLDTLQIGPYFKRVVYKKAPDQKRDQILGERELPD